ncbi:alpha/beta hydrolase [Spirillospora sp. CA-255316]
MTSPTPPGQHRFADLRLRGASGRLRARLHWPAPADERSRPALLVFFHSMGEAQPLGHAADPLFRSLCSEAGVLVLAPWRQTMVGDLRLHDAIEVMEWAADHAAELGADPARLLVAGAGSGGGLAAAVASHAWNQGWPVLTRQVLIDPILDTVQAGTASGEPAGIAPAIVITSGPDPPRAVRRFAARLRQAGIEVDERHYAGALVQDEGGTVERMLADLASSLRGAPG